jgi:hypothetical protein
MFASRFALFATVVAAAGLTSACTRTVVYQERDAKPVVVSDKNGPPPHAPAHGYRHRHARDDVTLVYDADLDVYVVTGYEACYFSAGQYFRDTGTAWEWSVSIEGPWKVVEHNSDVPPGLRHRGHKHGRDKGKTK